MKKYPNSVIKGLMTALLFVMVIVTSFGFIVTAAAVAGDVYTTEKSQLRAEVTGDISGWMQRHLPAIPTSTVIRLIVFALDVVYALRYAALVITVAGLLLTVLLFCLLMRAAGHKNGAQEITSAKFDRLPFEFAALLMIGIPVGIHLMLYAFTQGTLFENWYFGADHLELSMFTLLLSPFIYVLSHTFVVRLKSHMFWKTTLVYRIFWKIPKRLVRSVKNAGKNDESGNIVPQWYDKVPLEIVAAVLFILPILFTVFLHDVVFWDIIVSARNYRNSLIVRGIIPFGYYIYELFADFGWILALAAAVTLLWLFACTVSVRYKCGILWTNTLTYRFWKWLKKMFRHLNHAGKRNESGELVPTWFDKIPLEIVLAAAIPLGLLVWSIGDMLLDFIYSDLFAFLYLLLCGAAMLYGLAYAVSVRLQLGTLWTNTIIYRIYRKLSGTFPRICRSIPLTWRTVLAVVLYCFFTFLILAFSVDPRDIALALLLWFPLTLSVGALLIYGSWATHTITQVIREMADGSIHKKTDPSKLFFIFRKQAEGLNSLGDGLQAAVEAQMKSERLKTELITNVSHDIKTPLTSIINYSDLLLAEMGREIQPDGKAAEYANTIYRHSLRLKKLTEDLVEASKAASGAITVNFERIELNQMLRQAVGEYAERLTAAGLTPVFRFTEEDVFISADGRLLWRVFDNLLSNIVKYSLEGTRVYITLTKNGDRAIVSFKNISRDTLNVDVSELMERFVRGDASRHSEGSGLGLNIALSLCERMNGRLELACDGDLFRADVTFPILE